MLAVQGTYENGYVKLDNPVPSESAVRVIITFLDDVIPPVNKKISLSAFSFAQSRKAMENYDGSFSDTLIEERRSEL